MISGIAAKYVFAACLCASVVDLVIVDFVVGPLALGPDVGPAAETAPGAAAEAGARGAPSEPTAPTTTTTTQATPTPATATATATDGGRARSGRGRSRVVARFESDQPSTDDGDLRALATAMIADPTAEIVLEGHTDQRGDPARNQALSVDRATWARNRLVELGVSASRIAVVGLGAERPLDTSDDDADVAQNRRVEVRWLTGSPSAEDGEK